MLYFFWYSRSHASLSWIFSAGVSFLFHVLQETAVPLHWGPAPAHGVGRTTRSSMLLKHQEGKKHLIGSWCCKGWLTQNLKEGRKFSVSRIFLHWNHFIDHLPLHVGRIYVQHLSIQMNCSTSIPSTTLKIIVIPSIMAFQFEANGPHLPKQIPPFLQHLASKLC